VTFRLLTKHTEWLLTWQDSASAGN
jgi:hypothetical protein